MWFPGILFYCFPLYCSLFLLHHGEECPLQAGKYHKEEEEGDDDDKDKDKRRKLMRYKHAPYVHPDLLIKTPLC